MGGIKRMMTGTIKTTTRLIAGCLVCRGGDLDSRPRAYESPALPLSYLGVWRWAGQILLWERAFVNVRSQLFSQQFQTWKSFLEKVLRSKIGVATVKRGEALYRQNQFTNLRKLARIGFRFGIAVYLTKCDAIQPHVYGRIMGLE